MTPEFDETHGGIMGEIGVIRALIEIYGPKATIGEILADIEASAECH